MPSSSPNDVYARKAREKSLRDAEMAVSPADRRARFPGEVQARLDGLREALPKHFSEPLSVSFTSGTAHDSDGGTGIAALNFTMCNAEKTFGIGSVNVVDNGKVEFFDRTAAMHEPAVHITFAELDENAVIEFMARLTERHLRL